MLIRVVEKLRSPVLIPGKGVSMPGLAQTLKRFYSQIRNIPPVAMRGQSTESKPGYHALWISPVHVFGERMRNPDLDKYSYRLLSTVTSAFSHAVLHSSKLKRGSIPLISFYRIGPNNTGRERLEQESGARFPLYIKEFPRKMQGSRFAATINAFPMYCLRGGDTRIGDLLFKDPVLLSRVCEAENGTLEQKFFHGSKYVLSAYYETLRMLLMLAECDWEA
jgi:hypothetical protein